ncbi:MAG: integration host factor subunit alpha [Nitrospirae bacterium]|uniref:Integration host factor subunit alpha n=1 Tax=hydrothermal vent metagenome TaxID=652676 RepID=A0A3B1D3V4_9ZZZZ|nr:integration host factor subunit alpha [Nitrospirota bacterium]
MTRAELAKIIFEKVGLPKKEAQDIIEIILDTMKQTLAEGESVKITGFGTFNVRKKTPRRGRNPQTGEEMEISARRVITFKPSNILKSMIGKQND